MSGVREAFLREPREINISRYKGSALRRSADPFRADAGVVVFQILLIRIFIYTIFFLFIVSLYLQGCRF